VRKIWRPVGSLILLGVIAWRMDWGQVGAAFAHLNVTLWLLAVAVYLVAQVVSALRWQLLSGVLGLGGRWGQYVAYYFIGMFFNLVLPTSVGGDVVRAWYLAGHPESNPTSGRGLGAFLSVFADRASGLVVLIAVACLAAACCPLTLPGWIYGAVAAAGGAGLLGLAALPALPRLRPLFSCSPRLLRLVDGALLYLGHRKVMAWATLLSVVVQVANVVLVWLIGRGLGLPVPFVYYGVLVPLVALLTLLPVSLNGMGLREAGHVLLLAPLGVGAGAAVTLSFLSFAVFTCTSLVGAGFYLCGRFPRPAARPPAALAVCSTTAHDHLRHSSAAA
jgi:uncharacterized membrane protein YbhN (UPF0104 family)